MSGIKQGSFLRSLAAIGPGMVVAGSVIGSGELVNTPVQAAKFGFVLLWAVLLSCVIKYFLQVEIGRYCMVHNRTTVQALNQVPGPRFRGTSWSALVYMLGYAATNLTIVGIIATLGELMQIVLPLPTEPASAVRIWGVLMCVLTLLLLWQGWYNHLEKLVMILVAGFSISAAIGLLLIQGTEYRISADEVWSGLTFSLGPDRHGAAFAVISLMGALGVSANELFMYPYWILEKGYARELGDPESAGWTERARQWIRTIQIDAGFSTILATLVTAAFFLLGCAVLFRRGLVPSEKEIISQVSAVYTASYGPWSVWMYLVGAFCTLFSTLVVVVAASGRMWADLFGSLGFLNSENPDSVRRCHQVTQSLWLGGLLTLFLFLGGSPVKWILAGHFILGGFMIPLIMFCICWLACHTDRRVRMSGPTAVALVGSVAVILACVLMNLAVRWEDAPQAAVPAATGQATRS